MVAVLTSCSLRTLPGAARPLASPLAAGLLCDTLRCTLLLHPNPAPRTSVVGTGGLPLPPGTRLVAPLCRFLRLRLSLSLRSQVVSKATTSSLLRPKGRVYVCVHNATPLPVCLRGISAT